MLDFVYQHLGKALLEAGRLDDATCHLEQALALRQRKADTDLVASTQAALVAVRRMRDGR